MTQEIISDVVEPEDSYESEEIPFAYDITSYGADYPVDGYVKRIKSKAIYIPDFQRGYVWSHKQASAFIESLLIGLPIPSIFLAKEQESSKLLVIDGQQRLKTLQYFYEGYFPEGNEQRKFELKGVSPDFEGKTYESLSEDEKIKLDDCIIPAIIVKQEQPSNDNSSIYLIFQRLNTGGTKLEPQEIRSCISYGSFNDLLTKLNETPSWRDIFGKKHKRMKDIELILRFFALYHNWEAYSKPMKNFLNTFMNENRSLDGVKLEKLETLFNQTISLFHQALSSKAFKPKQRINSAVFDSMMVGLASRIDRSVDITAEEVEVIYKKLLNDDNYRKVTVDTARTTDEPEVNTRLSMAISAFMESFSG